ncbi:hypothetical protein DFH07DRAFT_1064227 [Mycena maculata]|uniref:Uncharacterized protein n=1 Tax=Mycena maculata TaxID=230809 RepID=A0AAD7ICR8_9AGAR|nr:hypothetical protein DFH07DRAFT_1064227 [Mycena maculata]
MSLHVTPEGDGAPAYNALLFSAADLDPDVQHTVTWTIETEQGLVDSSQADNNGTTSSSVSSASTASNTPTAPGTSTPHKSKIGPIVGAVAGVVGALAIAGAVLVFLRRRKKSQTGPRNIDLDSPPAKAGPTEYLVEPYEAPMTASASLIPASLPSPSPLPSASRGPEPVVPSALTSPALASKGLESVVLA